MKGEKTSNAIEIISRRYVKDDPNRKAALERERVNADVAQMIYDLRQEKGLTQKQLADLLGTTQSVISRLEDADYEGHSLSMLARITKALNKDIHLQVCEKDPDTITMRYAFQEFIKGLRREKGLDIDALAKKTGIDRYDLIAMERDICYRPTPLALYKLSEYFKIPQKQLTTLVGAVRDISIPFKEEASAFAAKSDSFSKLSQDQKRLLDEFINFLRKEEDSHGG